jgi:DNA-binding MarR family transcriptional regulator
MAGQSTEGSASDIGYIFKTIHMVKRVLMKELGNELRQHDLDPSSGRALHSIIARGRLTMSELHDTTGFERGSLTTIVDGLIERGLVKRERGETDRRKVYVIPTPRGISRMLDRLSPKDRARFVDAIKTLEEIAGKL